MIICMMREESRNMDSRSSESVICTSRLISSARSPERMNRP